MVTEVKTGWNTLAILGFGLSFVPVASIAGIILSVMALNQIKKNPMRGNGLAIAGIIIGAFMTFPLFPILFF